MAIRPYRMCRVLVSIWYEFGIRRATQDSAFKLWKQVPESAPPFEENSCIRALELLVLAIAPKLRNVVINFVKKLS